MKKRYTPICLKTGCKSIENEQVFEIVSVKTLKKLLKDVKIKKKFLSGQ
jgi:hypothetical protein